MKDNIQRLENLLFITSMVSLINYNNVFCFLSHFLQALGMLSVLLLILRMEQTVEKVPLTGGIRI